jgi:hypothetical protein
MFVSKYKPNTGHFHFPGQNQYVLGTVGVSGPAAEEVLGCGDVCTEVAGMG